MSQVAAVLTRPTTKAAYARISKEGEAKAKANWKVGGELTSTSRLTTPVDLLLGFFLRWLEGCNDDGEAEPEAVLVVTLVPELDEVIVTDGTSTFSAIDQYCLSYNAVQQHPYEKRSMGERERRKVALAFQGNEAAGGQRILAVH